MTIAAYVLTTGAPTLARCLAALERQRPTVPIRRVDDVRPHAAAQQAIVDRCQADVAIKVDEDMDLAPDAIARLARAIAEAPPDVAAVVGPLLDEETGLPIFGVRAWRVGLVRTVPFEDHPLGDARDRANMLSAGLLTARMPIEQTPVLGVHLADPRPPAARARWIRLWARHRLGGHLMWIEAVGPILESRARRQHPAIRDVAAWRGWLDGRDGHNG